MKKHMLFNLLCAALILFFGVAMTSCGGGGGGSSSSLTYTGTTSQASITETNAVDLLGDAYMGGDMGSFPVPVGAVQSGQASGSKGATVYTAAQILKEAVNRVDMSGLVNSAATGTVITDQQTINGTCGGTASISITFDDVTGDFSGTFTFRSYDECSEVIDGRISFSGVFEILAGGEPGEILNMTMSFSALSVSGGEIATIAGEITITANAPTETITIDVLLHDGVSDQIFWIHDYNVTVTSGVGYEDVTVSGTFYDPVEGFVVLTTPVAIRILSGDEWPSSGTLEIEGANGTKARLVVIDSTEFYVLVEAGDDNLFDEWDSRDFGQLFWADL